MKSLHVPYGFYPDVVGGTEVYVAALAAALARQNHPAMVAAPANAATEYVHAGIPVFRFAVSEAVSDVLKLYDEGDPGAAEGFGRILDRERPDVVHLHAFTRACSVLLVRAAKKRGIPVVFTYHTPTVSCARGELMLWGQTPCDGMLDVARCAACALEGHGIPKPLAQLLARLPSSGVVANAQLRGRAWTAFRFSSLIRVRHAATRALFEEVDRIVAFRDWVRTLLVSNGVPEHKIVSSRHALCNPVTPGPRAPRPAGPLRLVFMGRLDPTKGVELLVQAIHLVPHIDITLDIYGAVQGATGERELARLRQLANGDARVTFKSTVEAKSVVDTIAAYDVLAVPSRWMETGPLVVLEAFAAGVPVLGSRLGGIGELVSDNINGLLVGDFQSPRAWADALTRLSTEPQLLPSLRSNVQEPPTMDQTAIDMARVYEAVTASRSRPAAVISSVA